jgi:hypothetical protein
MKFAEKKDIEKAGRGIVIHKMATKALEQEPYDELDFVQPHKKVPVNLEVCKMREDKGVLEQLAEEQNNLLASTKAWSDAIEKNGYVN